MKRAYVACRSVKNRRASAVTFKGIPPCGCVRWDPEAWLRLARPERRAHGRRCYLVARERHRFRVRESGETCAHRHTVLRGDMCAGKSHGRDAPGVRAQPAT